MKLNTKMRKQVEAYLKGFDFHAVHFDTTFKPSGYVITDSLDRGYFDTELSDDEKRIRVTFQLLDIEPKVITLY